MTYTEVYHMLKRAAVFSVKDLKPVQKPQGIQQRDDSTVQKAKLDAGYKKLLSRLYSQYGYTTHQRTSFPNDGQTYIWKPAFTQVDGGYQLQGPGYWYSKIPSQMQGLGRYIAKSTGKPVVRFSDSDKFDQYGHPAQIRQQIVQRPVRKPQRKPVRRAPAQPARKPVVYRSFLPGEPGTNLRRSNTGSTRRLPQMKHKGLTQRVDLSGTEDY